MDNKSLDLPGFVAVELLPNNDLCTKIIKDISKGELTEEVEETIMKYALGNPGATTVLTKLSLRRNIKSAKELEALIGWPLWSNTHKKAELIWDRFKEEI